MATSKIPRTPDAIVDEQVDALRDLGRPGPRAEWLRAVERRRSELRTDETAFPMVPIQLVEVDRGTDRHAGLIPVVRGELIAPADLEMRLKDEGFTRSEVDDSSENTCCNKHVRYRTHDPKRVVPVWRALRGEGAQPSSIVMLGDTVKGPNDPARAQQGLDPHPGAAEVGDDKPLVVVIDTGLDVGVHVDGWLDRNDVQPAGGQRDVDPVDVIANGTGAIGSDNTIDPCAGHGTFVTGVIRRVAPSADVYYLRAVDSEGFASDAMVAAAICRAIRCFKPEDDGPTRRGVINMSLGGETVDNLIPPIIECALRSLPPEVVVVAAAGNEPTGIPIWPAASKRVVSVAALGRDGRPADWSNFGSTVDFAVLGEGIVSTFVDGIDASGDTYGVNDYAIWSGTSFATPQIAAQIALNIVARPNDPVEAAVQDLRNLGIYTPGWGSVVDQIDMHG